jgi:hypothetical protein
MVTVIEYGYFAPAGVFASNLYSIFNRFGTGIKQSGTLFELSRGSAVQDFTDLKVRKVRSYGEKRMC